MKKFSSFVSRHMFIVCLVFAPIINLVIEMLARKSFAGGFEHIGENPLVFLYNTLIILATLSISLLFKRKLFFIQLISILWLALGITNGIIIVMRPTPLSAIDFFLLKAALGIIDHYLTYWQMGLIVLGIIAVVVLEVFIWKKDKEKRSKILVPLIIIPSLILSVAVTTFVGQKTKLLSTKFINLTDAYDEYGFVYCFSASVLDTGITRPKNYSEKTIKGIFNKLPKDSSEEAEIHPDIVMIQLESFFDPKYIKGLELSENPLPAFEKLKEENPSGFLSVSTIGGGTANTEFEVLTGMTLSFFGLGEYPYVTVLSGETCESLPYNLRTLGYTSHAIHNYTGAFYDRHKIYPKLGFDTFTPLEYMSDVEYNPFGWATDMALIPKIKEALDSSDGNHFVYAVSVQGHGGYSNDKVECKYNIRASGIDEKNINQTEYYVNQIKEMDDFIRELLLELQNYDRPIMAVLFGDHLPPLDISGDDLDGIDLYQTEYVIWSNFGLTGEDKDIEAYQLSARALELIGYNCGTLTKVNQLRDKNPDYEKDLCLLQYDMLYGNKYSLGMKSRAPTEMQFGINPPKIEDVYVKDGNLYVEGEHFTECSRVEINGKNKNTVYISPALVMVENCTVESGDKIYIEQVCPTQVVLGKSNEIEY